MQPHRPLSVAFIVAGLLALTALVAGGPVSAQSTSGTPAATRGKMGMDQAHPAHIHNSTCATLGSIAWNLNDVSAPNAPVTMMGTPVAGTRTIGNASMPAGMEGKVVAQSTTVVQVHLSDLEKAPFAINVHQSVDQIQNYIACADITGTISKNSLTVQLKELNGSGFSGTAILTDDGTGMTTVTIQLMSNGGTPAAGASPMTGSPMAGGSPAASSGQSSNAVTVTMKDIAFEPTEFTIPANTDVTVTILNQGVSMHSFVVNDRNNPNVKNLGINVEVQPGATGSVTINAPAGDYYYYCSVPGHEPAGMYGTMHVQ